MRQIYKLQAIAVIGLALMFAQDASAQRRNGGQQLERNNAKNDKSSYYERDNQNRNRGNRGKDVYARNKQRRNGSVNIGFRYGGDRYRLGRVLVHHGRVFRAKKGVFYEYHHGQWFAVNAPIGLRVDFIPPGARKIHSRKRDVLFVFRDTFYMPTRYGAVVVAPPRRYGRNDRYDRW